LKRVPKTAKPVDWSASGKSYVVPKQRVLYRKSNPRKIRTEEEWFPELSIEKSTIARGGKGVHAKQNIAEGEKVSEYGGSIVAVCDADKLRDSVIYSFPKPISEYSV
jgi:hypothetical protein